MTEDSDQVVKEEKENAKSGVTSSRVKSSSSNKTSSSANSLKKDKTRETQPTRIVIRHLPPTMTSEEFLEAISPVAEHNDYYFCKAETSLGIFSYCRAYINFVHMEDLFIFKDKFDDYVFVDSKGNEFPAIVEFAPFQRIFRRRFGNNGQPISAKKRDNKSGTIEQDPDYTQFLEDLEKMKTESNMPSAEVYLEEIEARDKQMKANHGLLKMSTPLIEFIKNKKAEKMRLREERREERRRQQLEQKRLREEEQNKKMKVLKNPDDKVQKDSDQKSKDKPEDEKPRGGDKSKAKDLDKKSRTSFKRDADKRSEKKSDKRFSNSHKTDKSKDKEKEKEKETKESTFVVKVVDEKKSKSNVDRNETKNCEPNANDSKETSTNDKPVNTESKRCDKLETSSSKDKSESSRSDMRRIRNKDRPTREIYKPGAKRGSGSEPSQSQGQTGGGGQKSGSSASASKGEPTGSGYKQRVFTRSKQ